MVITRSKKKKLENRRNDNFDEIPLDLVIEIFRRLPVKFVARFLLVSKSWARIIRSRHFITSYPFVSCSSQPRVLVAFFDRQRGHQDLYSFSQSLSSTSFVSCAKCPLPFLQRRYQYHPMYVNGLISLGYGKVQFITNPSTGRSIALPSIKIRKTVHEQLIRSFFGYDSVNDQYKVLCMVNLYALQLSPSTQHQVLTLGTKKSWRMIKCSIPHRPDPYVQVCIDGVVYYFAKTGVGLSQWSLMRFELKSEKFDIFTNLSAEIQAGKLSHHPMNLINYKGKVALYTKTSEYIFEVWVIDQYANNHGWLKVSFSVEPWKSLYILGTVHGSGELILAPSWDHFGEFNVIFHNPDTNSLRNAKVEVNDEYEFKRRTRALVFPDYVESVRLL